LNNLIFNIFRSLFGFFHFFKIDFLGPLRFIRQNHQFIIMKFDKSSRHRQVHLAFSTFLFDNHLSRLQGSDI
jgi:hypothetical protein